MKSSNKIFGLILVLLIVFSSRSDGYGEDVCWINGWTDCNYISPACMLGTTNNGGVIGPTIKPKNSSTATCIVAVEPQIQAKTNYQARSQFHFDATLLIALAVGIRADIAYSLAAYNQAADLGHYAPLDSGGNPMAQFQTIDVNGLFRGSDITGGAQYHIGAVSAPSLWPSEYKPYVVNPSVPRLDDPIQEGMLYHFRQWGFSQRSNLCAFGMTNGEVGNSFTASECYQDPFFPNATYTASTSTPQSALIISARKTATSFSGTAILSFPFDGFNSLTTSTDIANSFNDPVLVTMSTSLASLKPTQVELNGTTPGFFDGKFGYWGQRSYVDEKIIRFGIYLHILQDRVSHYQMIPKNTIELSDGKISVTKNYSDTIDHTGVHAMESYYRPLDSHVYDGMNLVYDEMESFVKANPEYKDSKLWTISKSTLIGSVSSPGQLFAQVLNVSGGAKKTRAFCRWLSNHGATGYWGIPGFSSEPQTSCPSATLDTPAPSDLKVTRNSTSQVNVSWRSGGGSTKGFYLAYASGAVTPDCTSGMNVGDVTSKTINMSDSNYTVSLCAVDSDGLISNEVRIGGKIPTPAQDLKIKTLSNTSFNVSWNYDWRWGGVMSNDFQVTVADKTGIVASSVSHMKWSHNFENLKGNTDYTITVTALDSGAASESVVASWKSGDEPAPPSPKYLSTKILSSTSFSLTWSTGGGNTKEYAIEITGSDKSSAVYNSVKGLTYTFKNLKAKTTYQVRVYALSSSGTKSSPVTISWKYPF